MQCGGGRVFDVDGVAVDVVWVGASSDVVAAGVVVVG